MKLYFFLGATGWWAKFILVIHKLKNLDKNINVNGIIMPQALRMIFFQDTQNIKFFLMFNMN